MKPLLPGLASALLAQAGLGSPSLLRGVWRGVLVWWAASWVARRLVFPPRQAAVSFAFPGGAAVPRKVEAGGGSAPAAAALLLAVWGAATGFLLPGQNVIPVLTYHRIAAAPRRGYPVPVTSPSEFAWQMAWLHSHGYRTVSPEQAFADPEVRDSAGRAGLPAKPVIITFDDGWRDNYAAARLMRRYGFRGAIFVVAGQVGRPLQLTGAQLRTLQQEGFAIGSHTMNHLPLARLPAAQRRAELEDSRRILSRLLGKPVTLFACPCGSGDLEPWLPSLLRRAGYRWAFASHGFGLNVGRPAPYAVRRVLISRHPLLARLEFLLFFS